MVSTLTQFHLLDVVAVKHALPNQGIVTGQVGTLVEQLSPSVFEVEFSDDDGQTYAMLPLHTDHLIKLYYSPITTSTPVNKMANTIHQYGQGDNVAGDKVMGNKIGTQISGSSIGSVVNEAKDNAQVSATDFTQTSGASVAELLQLVASLRQSVMQFPPEAQEDLIIEVDDIEAEVKKPVEQRNMPKFKKRLIGLATSASIAATGITGGLTLANEIVDQATELGSKVGIELQLPSAP